MFQVFSGRASVSAGGVAVRMPVDVLSPQAPHTLLRSPDALAPPLPRHQRPKVGIGIAPLPPPGPGSQPRNGTRRRVVLMVLAVLITGVGAIIMGTMSTFTSVETRQQTAATGTFVFDLAAPGSVFTTDIAGVAPGDTVDRLVSLTNSGAIGIGQVNLTITTAASNTLATSATHGLFLSVDRCTVAWTQATTAAAATCTGGTSTALTASTALATLNGSTALTYSTTALNTGATTYDYLRLRYSLPSGAVGTSGLEAALTFTFTATQVAGGTYR